MNFQKFATDPYKYVDELSLTFRGANFNLFQKYRRVQKTIFAAALICLGLWILLGIDSTPLQFTHVLFDGVPAFLQGSATIQNLHTLYDLYYGKEMHYSAFVIYFLLYWALSKSWEKAGVTKSKNIIFSFGGMILSVAVFEWFWILGFATFQNQPWVATWQFPQMRILIQNTVFAFAGGGVCLFMLTERYFWNGREQLGRAYYFDAKNWKLWLFIILSLVTALLWIYYPGQIQQISVQLKTGEIWHSSRLFPQTLYTVDLNPSDSVNAGDWFYVNNDLIHGLNTIVKLLWALSTYFIFKVRRKTWIDKMP